MKDESALDCIEGTVPELLKAVLSKSPNILKQNRQTAGQEIGMC